MSDMARTFDLFTGQFNYLFPIVRPVPPPLPPPERLKKGTAWPAPPCP